MTTRVAALAVGALLAASGCSGPAVDISRADLAPRDIAEAPGFEWVRDSVGPFRIYAEAESGPARRMDEVKEELGAEIAPRIQEVLGRSLPGGPVHVFLLDSPSDMKRLIGYGGNGISGADMVLNVLPEGRRGLGAHELMHVAAARLFGPREGYGAYALNEGLAVFASGAWWGHDLHSLTKHLRSTDRGLRLRELLVDARAYPETRVYPQAGSFVAFLYERFGAGALSELLEAQYPSQEPRLEAVLGVTLDELEAGWDATVATADAKGIEYRP